MEPGSRTRPSLWPRRPSRTAALLLALAAPAGPALAVDLPIDTTATRYQRTLRAIEGRAAVDPAGAAGEAARARRRLITENGGVDFSGERARIDRRLNAIQAQAPAAEQPDRVRPEFYDLNEPLPSSYADETGDLPSARRELRLVGNLLDRADAGLGDGDAEGVSSDIATAETSLAGLAAAVPETELKPLHARVTELRRRLAAMPPGRPDSGYETAPSGRSGG